jgi:polyisoprenoid-binding protein YceI
MKKLIILSWFISIYSLSFSQEVCKSSSCEISFFSETPMENIDAVNKDGKAILNTKTNELVFVVTIIGFKFKKPLMEEHFNENYMESDKYKTAHFKGQIIGDVDYLKNGEYKVKAKGVLNIHGVDKEREISGVITVKNGAIELNSSFDVNLKDHKIKIPKMVIKNIAETVKVTIQASLLLKTN